MNPINRSKVMKRAWRIFKGNSKFSRSFSDSIKRAWQIERENTGENSKHWMCSCYGLREYTPMVEVNRNYNINEILSSNFDHVSSWYKSEVNVGD